MICSHIVNDKLVMYNIRNIDATKSKNATTAVGIVEGASMVGSGYMIGQSTYSYVELQEAETWAHALIMMPVFFIIGQAALLATVFVSNWVSGKSIQEQIRKGNCAAATYAASRLIAISKLLGDVIGKSDSLLSLVLMFTIGLVVLHLVMIAVRVVFLFAVEGTGMTKRHDNSLFAHHSL